MNLYNKMNGKRYFLLLLLMVTQVSCEDYLEVQPEDRLVEEQHYRDVNDADAAVLGIYGQFMNLAEEHVILNELRADLMAVTVNADPELREIQAHAVTPGNSYADPSEFYEVILSINDALDNFDKMLADKRLTQEEYNQRYSDIGALRSWIYLQLGIHYGDVPYVTDPLDDIDDVQDESKFPVLEFEMLLDELLSFAESLPYTDPYMAENLLLDVDSYETAKFFINKNTLLGDLHLWNGNFTQAATYYRIVMDSSREDPDIAVGFDNYIVRNDAENFGVTYLDNNRRDDDARALYDNVNQGWGAMFSTAPGEYWNNEWIWVLPFSSQYAPANPFIDLFSPIGGEYVVKPSERAMDLWNAQTQLNGFPYDARGKRYTYKYIAGEPVIVKYIDNYVDFETMMPLGDIFDRDGQWFLYRAAKLHLRFAEAANRDGRHRLASALLNIGIHDEYSPEELPRDRTNIQQTHDVPPYDFYARQGGAPDYRDPWHRNDGIRGRAYLEPVEVVGDSLIAIENNLIQEAALELAYEGNRWGDLVRIARRRDEPSFLADRVYAKLVKEGYANAAEVRSKLMNPENWYLPFEWEVDEQ